MDNKGRVKFCDSLLAFETALDARAASQKGSGVETCATVREGPGWSMGKQSRVSKRDETSDTLRNGAEWCLICTSFILTGWLEVLSSKGPGVRLNQTNKHAPRQRFRGEKIRFF